MQGISPKHRVLGRSLGELDARDPSLINLSLPVDSVPVLAPLVSPLVGNGAGGGGQPSTPPNPQPAPVSTSGNGNGDGNGKGNGGDNGGGNGHGNGGGNTPMPTPTPTSGGGSAVPPEPTIPSPAPPTSAPGTLPSPSVPSPSSPGSGGNFLGTGGGQPPPMNVGAGSFQITSAALGASTPAAISQYSDANTAGAAAPTISAAAAVSSGKQLSVGAVAGITVACLISLLAVILLLVRRRSIAHRLELREQWWFSRNAWGHPFRSPRSPAGANGEAPGSRLSARSSFATNFDQGLMLRIDSPTSLSLGVIPEFPPAAEVRERNSVLISTGGAVARRESMNSMLSNGSDPDAQYLAVSTDQNNLEPSTLMSVRPFSPSEFFAFPKPPAPPSSTADSFIIDGSPGLGSSQSSATTLVHLNTPPRAFLTDLPPALVPASPNPQTSTTSIMLSPSIAATNPSMDPFVDPPKSEFSNVEVIRRPFTPSLDDEMSVLPGDRVRIVRVFDDGWAFVEKLASIGVERHERGLIPVDCFRDLDQALPSFLSEKRVSYGSQNAVGTAL